MNPVPTTGGADWFNGEYPNNGYLRIKRGTGEDRRSIVVFTSDAYGYIRNAETGEEYRYRIGSRDEELFFKVILGTGETHYRNRRVQHNDNRNVYSNVLFFESPQRYAKYMMSDVDQETIARWEERRRHRIKEIDAAMDREELVTMEHAVCA